MLIAGQSAAGNAVPLAVNSTGGLVSGSAGFTASASFTPAATAYGAADVMSVAQAFAFLDAAGNAIPSASLICITAAITKIDVTAVPSGQTSYTLYCYSVTPPSAQADNAAWTLASADLPSYLGSIALGTPADLGAALYIRASAPNLYAQLAGTSLFGVLVTDGAHTAAAVARQIRLHCTVI
ncbi:hypothetical protein UFOVP469_54 [uncultured Caudovirales phage]|uniref:Uncharacterized protein n=1 Tax=uncultured Caudovirales phage TaxID=2100421 RepID=A0A6J5MDX6_9CAUD|nr:hypothetical protein UFOVP469_54 [uncultured Caudovirales phage]CAB4189979.1 hypothetical protein UFOVP1200_27 [uncultured Caudovirales phage]